MPLRLSDKCFGVVKAVPGRKGTVFGVSEGVLEFHRVLWGVFEFVRGTLGGV